MIGLTGALAGLFHVLSGPDHLAAVAPLAASDGRRGWISGWTWGLGHASGVVLVAVVAILLRDALPPIEVISAWSERLVGAALIAVGLWAFRRSARVAPAPHVHSAREAAPQASEHERSGSASLVTVPSGPASGGAPVHVHLHVQRGPAWFRRLGHAHASFYLGVLHGIAGSSHFFGVLPALALPTRAAALTYIAAFGGGTVIAMTAFAAIVGSIGSRAHQTPVGRRTMMMAAATLAIVIGGVWIF
jgi:hypothetical protein